MKIFFQIFRANLNRNQIFAMSVACLLFAVVPFVVFFILRVPSQIWISGALAGTMVFLTFIIYTAYTASLKDLQDEWTIYSISDEADRLAQTQVPVYATTVAVAGFVGSMVCILLGMLSEWPFLLVLVPAILALSAMIFDLTIVVTHKRDAMTASEHNVRQDLLQRQPAFCFYFSGVDLQNPYHVTMWLPYLESLNLPFVIVVGEKEHLKSLKSLTTIPVFLCTRAGRIATLLPKSITTVFYANNGMKNVDIVKNLPDRNHVQLLHGDSDKPASFNPISKIYSYLFVAGQMAIERYTNNNVIIPAEKFRIVGRPQISCILPASPEKPTVPTVAYLPTWLGYHEDAKFSSLEQSAKIIDLLMEGPQPVRVIFKPHPLSHKHPDSVSLLKVIRNTLTKTRTNGSTGRFDGDEVNPIDIYNEANVLLADVSSVIIDFLYSGKPYIVTNPRDFDQAELLKYPSLEGGYILANSGENICELVTAALDTDPMMELRQKVRHAAFGDLDLLPGEMFRRVCLEVIEQGKAPASHS